MKEIYRAAILTGPEKLCLENLPVPILKEDEVFIEVKHVNLCPTDLKKYFHLDGKSAAALSKNTPVVLGHEASGIIAKTGSAVRSFAVGDKVAIDPMLPCRECVYCKNGDFPMCLNLKGIGVSAGSVKSATSLLEKDGIGGCFAEFVKVPEKNLYRLPDSIDLEAASLMEPLADVIHSIEAGDPQEKETAVVFGLGAMGLMHIRVLSHIGVKNIIGVDLIEERLRMAEEFGATQVIDPKKVGPETILIECNQGTGPDVIFVCTGGEAQKLTATQALNSVRKGGRILLYASALKPADIPIDINHIHYGMIKLTGTVGFYHRHALRALEYLDEGVVDVRTIRKPISTLEKIEEVFKLYGSPKAVKAGIDIG